MDAVLAAVVVALGLIGVAAWRNFGLWGPLPALGMGPTRAADPVRLDNGLLAVAPAVRAALARVRPEARRRLVRLEFAVPDDLGVRIDAETFDRILANLLLTAIRSAPAGRVLVTGRRHGGRVEVTVSGDGDSATQDSLIADLRPADEMLALNGGTLEVRRLPDTGTVFVARLLEPQGKGGLKLPDLPQPAPAPAPTPSDPDPAKVVQQIGAEPPIPDRRDRAAAPRPRHPRAKRGSRRAAGRCRPPGFPLARE